MSAPTRKPFYYDFSNSEDGLPPEQGAPWVIDDFVSIARHFTDWLVEDRRLPFQVRPLAALKDGAARISFAGDGHYGLIELTPDPSGWVLVVGKVGEREVFRGYLDRPYEHYELWPVDAEPAADEEGPGRIGKIQSWIGLSADAWPALKPLADERGWVTLVVDEDKLRQSAG